MVRPKNLIFTDLGSDTVLYLELEGIGKFPLQHFSSTFTKNSIPEAVCTIGMGRDARNGKKKALIHEVELRLTKGIKAKVWFKPQGEWNAYGDEWDGVEKCIFDGYYVSPTYQYMAGQTSFALRLSHWALALCGSSTISRNFNTSSSLSLVDPAAYELATDEGAKKASGFVSQLVSSTRIEDYVSEDMTRAIKEVLCELAQQDIIYILDGADELIGDRVKNDQALSALSRIEGPAKDCPKEYKYAKPSKPQFDVIEVYQSLARVVAGKTLTQMAHATFWDAIVRIYCPQFGLQFVPLVDRALIVPDCPTFSKKQYDRVVTAESYGPQQSTSAFPTHMRGIAVFGNYHSDENAELTNSGSGEDPRIGGYWAPGDPKKSLGSIVFRPAPEWLQNVGYVVPYARGTAGVGGAGFMRTSTTPGAGAPPAGKTVDEMAKGLRGIYTNYAKFLYSMEALASSSMVFSGRLRWDICPGAMLRVNNVGEADGSFDTLATPLYGQVVSVNQTISADPPNASTRFQLGWVRTQADKDGKETSLDAHPLYGEDVFLGAPLVTEPDDAWAFAGKPE